MTITTKSNKADREVTVGAPDVLKVTTVADAIAILGEDVALTKIKAQLTIDFRSHIRGKLESMSDDAYNYTDEEIIAADYSDWKPEARTRKSSAEKAAELLGKMSPEELKAAMAAAGIEMV